MADTRLEIATDGDGERWERRFGGEVFTTKQWEGRSLQLVERFGRWELFFKLRVAGGALFYDQQAAKLCLGAWRLSIPRVCAPFVRAHEKSDGDARVLVSVLVTLPLVGRLIGYEGYLDVR